MDEIQGILEMVTGEVRKKFSEMSSGGSIWEAVMSFVHAVDWREPWLIGLMAFHVVLLFLAIATRGRSGMQSALFFTLLSLVFFAERINTIAAHNWQSFSKQHYFDPHGVFTSTVFSAPLLLITVVILINSLVTLTHMIVAVKRAELRVKKKQRELESKKDS